jgi:hypothetical protein
VTEFNTLLLDQTLWDLVLDQNGNIALAAPPYALAQDVASAVKTFLGEVFYDTTLGVPYFQDVLGKLPPASLLTQLITDQALTVPGVVTAQTNINSFDSGSVSGQIIFTDENDQTTVVNFG